MIPEQRKKFNANFTEEKYKEFLQKVENLEPGSLEFRVTETPIFVPKEFTAKMLQAGEEIIDVITSPNFKQLTGRSMPEGLNIPGEDDHPQLLVLDFGICRNKDGHLEPQLIEMQGFPSLFGFQAEHTELCYEYSNYPEGFSAYLNGYEKDTYLRDLKEILIGPHKPEEVVLLEINPEIQKTRIDFYVTQHQTGLHILNLSDMKADGRQLYYEKDGKKYPIKRIYNRVIFDDLNHQAQPVEFIDLSKNYDVEWVPHPNWFYRISKFTLPFIKHAYVPETIFLNEAPKNIDLSEYVLKPLFSFAGMGVVIDVQKHDVDTITDPENWILQRKVNYDDVIQTPGEMAKAEIRIFYFWKSEWERPVAVHNLSRMSKGKMIGTRYNKDKDWVGGTVAFFEQ